MSPRLFLTLLQKHFAPRERRIWIGDGRAHIEIRSIDSHELSVLRAALLEETKRFVEIRWAEVNQGTSRAVIAFVPGTLGRDELLAIVAAAELRVGVHKASFPTFDHPLDEEPLEKLFLELVADAAGLSLALLLKVSFLPRSGLLGTLSSALLLVRTVERLRRPLDEKYGDERVDLALGLAIGVLQGPAQRPLSALLDGLEKIALGAEMRAQKRLFVEQEAKLLLGPTAAPPRPIPERPVPLAKGPIEDYADRAWVVALGGFSVSFLSTRSVQRAFAALFGSIPRPARLGREVFSASATRLFSGHQMLVRDREAMRLLDRLDCLFIAGDLVPEDNVSLGRVLVCSDVDDDGCRTLAEELLDRSTPLARRTKNEHSLRPVALGGLDLPFEVESDALALTASGELLLGLFRREQLLALVEVRIRSRPGLEELVRAAHEAKMHVVIASNDPNALSAIPADDAVPAGDDTWLIVRELQREGRTVCVVAQGDSRALDVADVGVALRGSGPILPWSAHVLCIGDLDDVRLVIEASKVARDVSRQSVNIALGAAMLGAIASLGGLLPLTSSRVLTVVNLASLLSMGNGLRMSAELAQAPRLPPRDPTPFHALEAQGVLSRLESSALGLSPLEAEKRRPRTRVKPSAASEVLAHVGEELENPLVPLLSLGAGLSAVIGSFSDALMVGGVMGANALIGGVQRYRTERAIVELGKRTPQSVVVRRGGEGLVLSEHEVVRGDVIVISPGDRILFDCRLVEAQSLEVDASAITGESLPVPKATSPSFDEGLADRASMIYAGSTIVTGRGLGVVVAIGEDTEARRAGVQYRDTHRSGVERRMRQLMDLTGPIALVAGTGVVLAGILRGKKIEDVVGSAVSLAVASVPEGLPILATFAQLAAAKRLEKRGALVRNVRALEALGRVDTICFDKTGTLTTGALELALLSDGEFERAYAEPGAPLFVLAAALRASADLAPNSPLLDPLEATLMRASMELDASATAEIGYFERVSEIPYESARGFSAVFGRTSGGGLLAVKGSPEVLLPRSTRRRTGPDDTAGVELGGAVRRRIERRIESLSSEGYRVIAVAERSGFEFEELSPDRVTDLTFVGLVAFRDPLREGISDTIGEFERAGLRPVLITGDHPNTARTIAAMAGIASVPIVLLGSELAEKSDAELPGLVEAIDVFARVTPAQKARIVRALGKNGRVVAMVGDGSNDAAAIRLAAVGVAMGKDASDAARGAADLIIADARLETLGSAIVEGRAVWDSVRDAVSVLVGGNIGEIGFTLLGGLVSGRPPLSPRQLLLVNLFTDVAPATALAVRPPKNHELASVAGMSPDFAMGTQLTRDIYARAIVTASGAGVAWGLASFLGDRRGASTTALLALVGTQLGQTYRSGEKSPQVLATSVLTALGMFVVVQTPGVSHAFGCRPLGPVGWSIATGSSALATILGESVPDLLDRFFPQVNVEKFEGLEFEDAPALSRHPSLLPRPSESY